MVRIASKRREEVKPGMVVVCVTVNIENIPLKTYGKQFGLCWQSNVECGTIVPHAKAL